MEMQMPIAGEVCPICGSEGDEAFAKDKIRLRVCNCVSGGTLLSWAYPDEASYLRVYSEEFGYHVQMVKTEGLPESYERDGEHLNASRIRVKGLESLLGRKPSRLKLLDVGSGLGGFVQAATEAGYDAVGLDPSPDACSWAIVHNRLCHVGSWQDVVPSWDIITLHDVFEHLTRPDKCLRHLRSCLGIDGVLIIEMPEWNSPHQQEQGWDWRHIKPRSHLCLYSRESAEELFVRNQYHIRMFFRPLDGSLGKATWVLNSL
jgi:SAM-dependent methyltransferase